MTAHVPALDRPAGPDRREVMPSPKMAQDFLHHTRVVNDGDDAHGVLANGAAQRIHVRQTRRISPSSRIRGGCSPQVPANQANDQKGLHYGA